MSANPRRPEDPVDTTLMSDEKDDVFEQQITASDEGSEFRPRVKTYKNRKFRVADKVYITADSGRGIQAYLVSSLSDDGGYVLCTLDSSAEVAGGKVYKEDELDFATP